MMNKKPTPYRRAPALATSSSIEEALEKLSMKKLKNLKKAIRWQINKLNNQENNLNQSYKEYYDLKYTVEKIKIGKEACNWEILIKFGMIIKSIQQIQHDIIRRINAKPGEFSNVKINPNEISADNLKTFNGIIRSIIKNREDELKHVESEITRREKIREGITKSSRDNLKSGKYVSIDNLRPLYKNNEKVFGD
jgi:hypothetical protein